MGCCQSEAIEEWMDARMAAKELSQYREKGPSRTTRLLLDALEHEDIEGTTLLDIGGGVGAIQHELLQAGVGTAISVDASSAYLEAAREEAERQGHIASLRQLHGDFVKLANEVPEAEIVTLDRVICCYDDMDSLVKLSADRARRLYGVVYPRDHWLTRAVTWIENQYHRIRGSQFRAFAHPSAAVEALIESAGLDRVFARSTLLWQVHVYRRAAVQ